MEYDDLIWTKRTTPEGTISEGHDQNGNIISTYSEKPDTTGKIYEVVEENKYGRYERKFNSEGLLEEHFIIKGKDTDGNEWIPCRFIRTTLPNGESELRTILNTDNDDTDSQK